MNAAAKYQNLTTRFIDTALDAAHHRQMFDRWTVREVRPDGVMMERRLFGRTVRHYVRATGWMGWTR